MKTGEMISYVDYTVSVRFSWGGMNGFLTKETRFDSNVKIGGKDDSEYLEEISLISFFQS